MTVNQYKVVKIDSWSTLESDLNATGALGWELVNIVQKGSDYLSVFKRAR